MGRKPHSEIPQTIIFHGHIVFVIVVKCAEKFYKVVFCFMHIEKRMFYLRLLTTYMFHSHPAIHLLHVYMHRITDKRTQ